MLMKMDKEKLQYLNKALEGLLLNDALALVIDAIDGRKVFSTSFGIEDQLLTHYVAPFAASVEVFTLDTGRQFNETYEVFQRTLNKYPAIKINTYFPDEQDIAAYVNGHGVNGFYNSKESRQECCYVRKIKPLQKAIAGASLWITGVKTILSQSSDDSQFLEWDEENQLVKYNPLLHHSLSEVEQLANIHNIPVSSLHKKGYLSIGCAPCTRALSEGEDYRAGQWWWENGKKEYIRH